jgi:hypothetical protein
MKNIEGKHPPTILVWEENYNQLQADNRRLADLVTRHDTVLRKIAAVSGFTGVYTGVDVDPECSVLVDHVKALRSLQEAQKSWEEGC